MTNLLLLAVLAGPALAGPVKISYAPRQAVATFAGVSVLSSFRLAGTSPFAGPTALVRSALPRTFTPQVGLSSKDAVKSSPLSFVLPRTPSQGRAFFDGAGFRLDQPTDGTGPKESSREEKIRRLNEQAQKYPNAIYETLYPTFSGLIEGWATAYSSKPSFPFVVDRQGDKWWAVASAQTRSNKANVFRLVSSRALAKTFWMEFKKRVTGSEPEFPKDDSPEFMAFYTALADAANRTAFASRGSLVVVGWGSGDHVTVHADTPDGPKTVTSRLANKAAQLVYDAERKLLAE